MSAQRLSTFVRASISCRSIFAGSSVSVTKYRNGVDKQISRICAAARRMLRAAFAAAFAAAAGRFTAARGAGRAAGASPAQNARLRTSRPDSVRKTGSLQAMTSKDSGAHGYRFTRQKARVSCARRGIHGCQDDAACSGVRSWKPDKSSAFTKGRGRGASHQSGMDRFFVMTEFCPDIK